MLLALCLAAVSSGVHKSGGKSSKESSKGPPKETSSVPHLPQHVLQAVLDQFDALAPDGKLTKSVLQAELKKALAKRHEAPFGLFDDPRHPGCPRAIAEAGAGGAANITGSDGTSGAAWAVRALVTGKEIEANFSAKGGPAALTGSWNGSAIKWADGNVWTIRSSPAPGCASAVAVSATAASVPAASSCPA
ncbi:hypothetical protein EMIHUDRAFT_224183 [Emiliania huxleyi CCMP1516]|uniref:Uncharacterized protein n=2 Tax=Emiliania huxleyi TaxID=2903 RepID=A0A0D3KSN8_EMIH1|nr:hypothetical protein EMIHUDRAFT_224183 [Emiliania huxleyi CCMP1516]EOD38773.1 hypothetical protein EMIHUDRAFT_224183 [Emiliania huxleyi CCMP1516]|eukprot:XP_005791202.1 hypothetical protein EMIHUDRAFT_224183 [Emiliania huxleyi CCMP1516]